MSGIEFQSERDDFFLLTENGKSWGIFIYGMTQTDDFIRVRQIASHYLDFFPELIITSSSQGSL